MNKIFRIVWSQATQSWVVVSELTKAHKKQSASNAQKSAVKFSGNFIKSSAIALTLLSGHSAYAATAGNTAGEGHTNAVAFGPGSNASTDGAVALGKQSKATGNEAAALGKGAKAEGNLSVAVGVNAQASANNAMALGLESKAKGVNSVALGGMAEATAESAMALGFNSKATSFNTVALGRNTQASGQRSMAFGNEAKATQNDTIAFGSSSEAKKINDIIIGKEAKSHDTGGGYSIAIGTGAISGSTRIGIETNPKTTEKKGDAGGVAIGTGAYTGVNRDSATPINSSVAIGAGAGAGFRALDDNKIPVGNGTDADDNAEVLRKAFGVNDINADYKAINGGTSGYTNVDINEGTAVGRHARAIGDQAVAIGAQTIAGMGAIALGGNDITQFANKKYYKSTKDNFKVTETTDHTQGATLSEKTISQNYQALVGTALDTNYKATYAQDGSVVLGAQAHSGTPLGTAIGTNALVRKGAFGATAIGAGSQIQANAEAAVAIGMGSVANGAYSLAAGTASLAEFGDIALGYQAKATGKDGAIAMGRATNAQGDSSIMIGGANIGSAAAQNTSFEKGNGTVTKKTVIEKINGKDVSREYTFAGTTKTNGTVAVAYKELTGRDMETNALNFADNKYKNGHASTSLGVHALSKGDLGTAIGASSRADAIGSVALGTGAHATKQNAVAIGTGSTTELVGTRQLSVSYDKDGNIVDDNSPDKAYTFNWAGGINTAEGDVVSFGSSGAERQLKNVAAGRVADDSTDAINGSQLNSIAKKVAYGWNIAGDNKKQTASVGSEDQVNFVNGNGTTVTVTKQEEVKNGNTVTTAKGANVKFDVKAADGSITSDANGISVNTDGDTIGKTTDGKLKANTGTINTGNDGKAAPNTGDGNKLATVDTVVNAVNNAAWKATAGKDGSGTETGKSEEKIKAGDLVTFKAGDNLAIKQAGKDFIYSLNPVLTGLTSATFTNAAGDTTVINGNGMTITPKDAPANPVSLTKDGLDNGGKKIKNVTSGLTNYPAGTPKDGLVDLSKPATGNPAVPDTTAATVGDLRNMGWVVSSDKTTGELTKAYTDQVKNADEVKFVGEGGVTVSGKTENGVRTITVKAEAQEMPEQPVSYTTADGTKVYPKTVTKEDGTKEVKYYSEPNGKGNEIPKGNVIASINGPEGTKAPTTLSNVAGNLDGAKKDTTSPTTNAAAPNNVDNIKNNAATVGDVLNAGWNLQGNGVAKDFVKPYDTVNFVNGANTTAVVTTAADGTTSNVTYNVTGLPVTFTDKDGKPVAKVGDKYYPVNEKGQPVTPDGKPAVKTNEEGKPVTEDGTVIEPIDTAANPLKSNLVNPNVANTTEKPNNQTTTPTQLGNVANGAKTFAPVDGKKMANDGKWYPADQVEPNGQPKTGASPAEVPANIGKAGLIDFSNSNPNNAATVGDLQNMGWVVSAQGNNYSDQVRNANEVKFVGEGTATVTGKTDENGVRTITVKVDDQTSTNNSVTPVSYTKPDGTKVYPKTVKNPDTGKEEVKFFEKPDGTGNEVPADQVVTSVNGPNGTKEPTSLKNVKNNIPAVNDTDKKVTTPDGKDKPNAGDVANISKAPLTATEAADLLNPTKDGKPNPNFVGNNAATVSDVLNAGWNLQNNGEARDFVKPFDTVNFVNGGNTTAVVTTAADGTTSDVTFNVTGLPITYTTADGKPVSKVGDKFYPVNEKGEPVSEQGNPVVGKNEAGDLVDKDGNVIKPIDTAKNPLKSNLVNPNVTNTTEKPNNQTTSPTTLNNVTSGLNKYGDTVDGAQVPGSTPANNGLVDLSKPADGSEPKVSDNTAATVGDLRNMGWIVSSDKTTGSLDTPYTATVKNANEVKFVGEGTATVSGKTDEKGVRTITVKVDDQVSTNNAVTPVVYTDKDGNKVYPIKGEDGTVTYHTTPDGKGEGDKTVPADQVVTSVNGPKGTKEPTALKNVKSNIPVVNDADKKVTNPDGTEKGTAGDVANINKAPLTATEVADLLNPTKDGQPNPNFVGNNAATVSDVLNAGWNLQNNGTAKDFVKPYDTVNFVDGANTTAVVTTAADGTTSNVTYNVTGLPITYTTADGKPVSKVGDKYYPVNEKGQPITADGKPAVKTNADGKPVTEDGTVIEPIDTKANPLQSNLVNPNVENTKEKPNNQTTSPTQLGNVANGANTFDPVDGKKMANDGKWYPADQVEPNGQPKTGASPAEVPANIGKAGLIDFSNSNPNNAATVGDLQNLGWIVSASGNNYSDQVRNANKVEFKGTNGVEVTGKTLEDGTREITVGIKEGTVTNNVKVTKEDGTVIEAIRDKDGKLYEKDVNGKVDKTKPVETTAKDKVENNGSGFVTGNTVATAIQESGWNVGLADSSKANEAFNDDSKALSADKLEKVNPDDNVRFADGKNTKVQAATMDEVNKDGKKITNTYVRFNVDLPISQITSEDKDGNKVAKAADGKWYPVKEGKPDTTKEALEPSNVRTSASMDPDGLGDKYTSTTSREGGLTPTQIGELTGKQEAAAEAAKTKIKELLKGQPDDVIAAASEAAVKASKEEATVQYLKDKGLDKGTGGTVISNVAWGTKPSDAVNVDQLQNSGINVHSRTVEGSTGKVISGNTSPTKVKMDETVNVDAGNNIEITRNGRDIAIATSMNPQFDSVQFGKEGPKITGKAAQPAKPATATSPATPAQPAELSVNGAKITDVAPGRISPTSTDAVNGSQLHAVASSIGNLNNKINKVGKRGDAGTASALAAANIPQAYTPGKSLVGIAAGSYQGQNGLAVGMSRISDNGKIIIRLSGTANSQGKTGVAAGVGYQW